MRYYLLPLAILLSACATPQVDIQTSESAVNLSDAALLTAEAVTPPTAVLNTAATGQGDSAMAQAQRFAHWKDDFTRRAIAKGYSPQLLAITVGRATMNERALERDSSQPEFTRPVWSYIKSAASPERIERGQAELADHTAIFDELEQTYGVPRQILAAIWGLESSYGRILGNHDIINSLATFAFEGRRTKFGEAQLFASLDLIQSGAVRVEQLTGSWAGAMGMTQFIPTTFRDYAVDFDRNGNTDLWTSEADALASAANYLTRSGWRPNEPVMAEVVVPVDFDYSQSESTKKTVAAWTALGARPANGLQFSPAANQLEAKLLAPAGQRGPKLLVFKNFDVIKKYNNSTSYVMGIASLGEALGGQTSIRNPWPEDDQPLTFEDKENMQKALTAKGFDTGGVDGQVGPATRRAIRAWQSANGLPADGYVEQRLLARIMAPGR